MRSPFDEPYKVDDHFGTPRSYGLHSGSDRNGTGGGNTDCGYKLYPITFSELVHASQANTGYGNIVVYKIEGEWGTRWVRYCHCDTIWKEYGIVEPNQSIATLGTTGNSRFCHLHMDVIIKAMTNWRTYARNKAKLNEYFEDPEAFMKRWKDHEGVNVNEEIKKLKEKLAWYAKEFPLEQDRVVDCRGEKEVMAKDFAREIGSCEDSQKSFLSILAIHLGSKKDKKSVVQAVEKSVAQHNPVDKIETADLIGIIIERIFRRK